MSATCLVPVRAYIRPRAMRGWMAAIHVVEQSAAVALLIALAPALVALALIIRIISRESPLIAHLRVGQHGRPLWVFKYRTMWGAGRTAAPGARLVEYIIEKACPPKPAADPRVTSRFARFCRRHSIDELPQLVHVARGEMSFVGPRPLTAPELDEHYGGDAAEILSSRPGLSGLWQTMGRNRLSYRQRLRLDLFLVRRCCVRLYFRVLWRTIPGLLSGKDAW